MPVYLLSNSEVVQPKSWMINPDDRIYTGWPEFAKQMFWDYQLGEVFIWALSRASGSNRPLQMRVVPPWMVNAEMAPGGTRSYRIGGLDVTADMLHIRYQSTTDDPHGHGPLEVAGARMTTAGLLQRYARKLAETGGTPHYWIGVDKYMNPDECDEMLNEWIASRKQHQGDPGLLSSGAKLNQLQSMSAKEMALLELAQFSEARIAVLLGVPPFAVGLPSGGDSLTYANVEQIFTFHDRAGLGPAATHVMTALSNWATTRPQTVELNRDDYTRPEFKDRVEAEAKLVEIGAITNDELRLIERFRGPAGPSAVMGNPQSGLISQPAPQDQAAIGGNSNGSQ